jgi:hypothetical protein
MGMHLGAFCAAAIAVEAASNAPVTKRQVKLDEPLSSVIAVPFPVQPALEDANIE